MLHFVYFTFYFMGMYLLSLHMTCIVVLHDKWALALIITLQGLVIKVPMAILTGFGLVSPTHRVFCIFYCVNRENPDLD